MMERLFFVPSNIMVDDVFVVIGILVVLVAALRHNRASGIPPRP